MSDPVPEPDAVEVAGDLRDRYLTALALARTVEIPPGMDGFDRWAREKWGDAYETSDLGIGEGVPGECFYFTFEPHRRGLVRARWETSGLWLEYLDETGAWVLDPGLLRRFLNPDFDFVKIDEHEADRILESRQRPDQ